MRAQPPVSIILPTFNERRFIRDCLDSLTAQGYAGIEEVLVVDGGSTDGTRELVATYGRPVRLVDNPGVTAASAMNVGLDAAAGDLIVRADAHTVYEPDYVARSVAVLEESGADWVGGVMRPVGETNLGKAVASVTTSPFGVGPGRFHYTDTAQDVETVYLGTFDRRIVWEVGGYDDQRLQWAAEDQELAFRLRRAGRRIRVDPSIRSWYFPRQDLASLARQYANYGRCKVSTFVKHRTLPYWRPLVPAALVAGSALFSAGAMMTGRRRAVLLPYVTYALGAGAVALRLADDPGVAPHRAFAVLATCHWSYGWGFLAGVGRALAGRPFDTHPSGHR